MIKKKSPPHTKKKTNTNTLFIMREHFSAILKDIYSMFKFKNTFRVILKIIFIVQLKYFIK